MPTLSWYLIRGSCHRLIKVCVRVSWNSMCDHEFSAKQERKYTYNVTLRRVRVTTVAVEKRSVY